MKHIKTFEFFNFRPKKDPRLKIQEIVSELRRRGYNFIKGSKLSAYVSYSSSDDNMENAEVWIYKGGYPIFLHPKYKENKIKVGAVKDINDSEDISLDQQTEDIGKKIIQFISDSKGRYNKKKFK